MKFFCFIVIICGIKCETLIEKANNAIQSGNFSEALSFYSLAIYENETNYLSYFLRGSLNEMLGRTTAAINDFSKSIEINPSFDDAKVRLALILIKQGELDRAESYLNEIDQHEAIKLTQTVTSNINIIIYTREKMKEMQQNMHQNKLQEAFDVSQTIIDTIPMCIHCRKMRVLMLEGIKNDELLQLELKILSQLNPNDLEIFLKLAKYAYNEGDIVESHNQLKRCLISDPDQSNCKTLFKKLKKIKKLQENIESYIGKNDFSRVLSEASSLLQESSDSTKITRNAKSFLCRANQKLGNLVEALSLCSLVIKNNPDDIEAMFSRAEIYMSKEEYEFAKSDYNEILQRHQNNQKATDALNKIENILKLKNKKDYYKILNVPRTATKQEIERAYKGLVKKWHPDRFRDEDKIKTANSKLEQLNQAWTVLTDDEKRKQYDSGNDPMDPQDHNNYGGGSSSDRGSHSSFFNFFQNNGQFRFAFG
uniref:DnaJ homolog subfamily C member 3 (Trinotate prediction) n=1 Tax=Myxobolus squamalis TaxID=59785 RepID=A0A6B2FX05_MYXSQ